MQELSPPCLLLPGFESSMLELTRVDIRRCRGFSASPGTSSEKVQNGSDRECEQGTITLCSESPTHLPDTTTMILIGSRG